MMEVVGRRLRGMRMVEAYVLIQVEVGRSAEVADAVGKFPGVRFADVVTGPYDIDMACDPVSPDLSGGLGTATTCPAKYLVRMSVDAAGCDFPPGLSFVERRQSVGRQ
jgi:hypothetical protein